MCMQYSWHLANSLVGTSWAFQVKLPHLLRHPEAETPPEVVGGSRDSATVGCQRGWCHRGAFGLSPWAPRRGGGRSSPGPPGPTPPASPEASTRFLRSPAASASSPAAACRFPPETARKTQPVTVSDGQTGFPNGTSNLSLITGGIPPTYAFV